MHRFIACAILISTSLAAFSKEVKDTLYTRQGDKIILSYGLATEGERISVNIFGTSRVIPSEKLLEECKGDLTKLKIVIFDQVGNYGNVKWNGITPSAFMVPSGLSHDKSDEGYYILGESAPIVFVKSGNGAQIVKFPVYIVLYEKKRTYRIINSSSQTLNISIGGVAPRGQQVTRPGSEIEKIAVRSDEELEADNDDVTKALSSIGLIRQLLESETELPFSQTLTLEIQSLRALKDRINDDAVIEKINTLFIDLNQKEKDLKEAQRQASLSAQAQQQALQAQQLQEEEKRQKAAEEEARMREEKQQKRTFLMIIGGVLLAVVGFIGNAVFKHIRDVNNQKSIMQMQESLTRQAQNEAGRRSREIVRNKAHQMANKGKSKLRESIKGSSKPKTNSNIKSI